MFILKYLDCEWHVDDVLLCVSCTLCSRSLAGNYYIIMRTNRSCTVVTKMIKFCEEVPKLYGT